MNGAAPRTGAAAPAQPQTGAEAAEPVSSMVVPESSDETGAADDSGDPNEISIVPGTRLRDAIQALARMANVNYLIDPKVINSSNEPVIMSEIHWTNITAASAMNALLANYDWQMVEDPRTHVARITHKDTNSTAQFVSKIVQLQYCDTTNIYMQLTNAFMKPTRIIADPRTAQLVIMAASPREMASITNMIEMLDRPIKQILIEARLFETTKNPKSIKGIDWSGTLNAQNFSFGNGVTSGTTTATTTTSQAADVVTTTGKVFPGGTTSSTAGTATTTTTTGAGGVTADTLHGLNPSTAFLSADGVKAVLSFLNSDTETKNFSLPRTVTQDGSETTLSVIRNVPIFEQNQSAGGSGQNNLSTMKPNYALSVAETIINEVGVKLNVTPRIVGVTNVFLVLKPEVSAQESVNAKFVLNGQENESPIFNRRKIVTSTTVPSGYTLVLGGLNNDSSSKIYTKVPLLGDIPGLGYFFRHENKERTTQNLMIFVTPSIIGQDDFQATKSRFMKTKVVDSPDTEESAWNNGKPYDWTKPKQTVEPAYNFDSAH